MGALPVQDVPTRTGHIDTADLKRGVDCRSLAEHLGVTLYKKTSKENAGPCPSCGGDDRFVVRSNVWQCRQCHDWADPIALVQHVTGADFVESCQMLATIKGQASLAPPPAQTKPKAQQVRGGYRSESWQRGAVDQITAAAAVLQDGKTAYATEAREYLRGRGLGIATCRAWGVGVLDHPYYGACLVLPWYAPSGQVEAIQYRIMSAGDGQRRYAMRKGSAPVLFGRPMLQSSEYRVLLAVEGELNALSLWQVMSANNWPVDVVSFGGEGAAGIDALRELAVRYGTAIVWADQEQAARKVGEALDASRGGALRLKSPGRRDANDHLQSGELHAAMYETLGAVFHLLSYRIATSYEAAQSADDRRLLWEREERLTSATIALHRAGIRGTS